MKTTAKLSISHLTFSAVIWKEPEGYVSVCSEIGVTSCGDTPKKALDNLREAIELYIQNAKELEFWDDISPAVTSEERYSSLVEVPV